MGPLILARGLAGRAPYAVEGPRQRARVHGAPQPRALPAVRARGRARRPRACWWARATRRRASGRCWPTSRRCPTAPGSARPAWTCTPSAPARRTSSAWRRTLEAGGAAAWGGEAGRGRGAALARPRPRPDRELRGQADRLEGRRPAAGRLAARGGAGARGAARGRGLRHLPRGAGPLRGGAAARATSTTCARSPRADASSRAGRPASCSYLRAFLEAAWTSEWLRRRARGRRADPLHRAPRARRPARPAARLRGAGDAEHVPRGVRDGGRRGGGLRRAAAVGRALRAWPRSRPRWRPALPEELRPLLSFEVGPRAVEQIAAKLVAWLTLDPAERERARAALAAEAAAPLLLGERGRGGDRGRPRAPRRSTASRFASG